MDDSAPAWRRPRARVAAAVALVVVAVVVVAVAVSRDGEARDAAPGTTVSSAAVAGSTPSGSPPPATPTADAGASAGPTADAPPAAPPPGAVPGPDGRPTMPPVPLDALVEPVPSVSARVTSLEAVEGVTTLPGEVGGPSVRVTVEVVNGTSGPLDLGSAVVNAYHGADLAPARGLLEPGGRPFPASVPAGATASGVYVFRVPVESRAQLRVELDIAPEATVVLLEGAAPA